LELYKLDAMVRGWFVGNFAPSVATTPDVEVGIKAYKAGDVEAVHFHKIATEITVILDGMVEMCGQKFTSGDIVKLPPGEATGFKAITDVTTVVIKLPSVIGDKYAA
jgi:quercetin dioxygenase-like cupin family protein